MNEFKPKYEEGTELINNLTDEHIIIRDVEFCTQRTDITYKVQNLRFRFKMYKLTESTIEASIDKDRMEVKQ